MKYTTNYSLKKPELNDKYDVDDFNDNADSIDTQLNTIATATSNAQSEINQVESSVGLNTNGTKPDFTSLNYILVADTPISAINKLDTATYNAATAASNAQSEINQVESSVGLNTDGTKPNFTSTNYILVADTPVAAINKLDTATYNAATAASNAQSAANNAQSEINQVESSVGLNTDGTKPNFTSTNYILAADSPISAINKLDTALNGVSSTASGAASAASNAQSEINQIESSVGLNTDGTKPNFTSTNYVSILDTPMAAINKLDTALAALAAAGNKIILNMGRYTLDFDDGLYNDAVIEGALAELEAQGGGVMELPNLLIPMRSLAIRTLVHIKGQGMNSGFRSINSSDATAMIVLHRYGNVYYATANATTDAIGKTAHGLIENDIISFPSLNNAVPAGLSADTNYYVKYVNANSFQVKSAVGGSALDITANSDLIVYYHYPSEYGHDFYANRFKLSNFAIWGNKDNQSNAIAGIEFNAPNGYYGNGSVAEGLMSGWYRDQYSITENVRIANCKGRGFYVPTASSQATQGIIVNGLNVFNCDLNNIEINSSDHNLMNIFSAASGDCGIYINGGNSRLTLAKTYYSANGGLYIGGSGTCCRVDSYEAQEEEDWAIQLRDCNNVKILNAVADSNGYAADVKNNTGVGIIMDGAQGCEVHLDVVNRTNLIGAHQYAIKWLNTSGSSYVCKNNLIRVKTACINNAALSEPMTYMNTSVPITNEVYINEKPVHLPNIFAKAARVADISSTRVPFEASSSSGLLITKTSHGLSDGNAIMFESIAGTLPTGLSRGTVYYVVNKTTDNFKVATTIGGSAIAYTNSGTGTMCYYLAKTADGWTHTNQSGITSTPYYDTAEQCSALKITGCTDATKAAMIYTEIPVTPGEIISVALQGKVDQNLVACTFTAGATDTVNATAHGLANGTAVRFRDMTASGGVLPTITGSSNTLSPYTTYYVVNTATDTFQVSETVGGVAVDFADTGSGSNYFCMQAQFKAQINYYGGQPSNEAYISTSTGSAVYSSTFDNAVLRDSVVPSPALVTDATAAEATDYVTKTSHGLVEGQVIRFAGTVPTGLSYGTDYYVKYIDTSNFQVETTPGGGAVNITADATGVTYHSRAVIARIIFAVLTGGTGTQDVDAYLRGAYVTIDNKVNERHIWKWFGSPPSQFKPLHAGQEVLDQLNTKIYKATGATASDQWVALN